ncbi:MAG: 3-oxoacyl-ACP reductase FabG [Thermodesulfobacteriota bacterium]
MSDFCGRKVVISGATRGIGRAIALAFLRRGAVVIGLYAGNQEAAASLRDEAGSDNGNLHLQQCDVASYRQVEELFRDIEERFDTIDVLVNNAGIRRDAVVAMMREEEWRGVIDTNLTGSFHMARFAVPLMMKQKYGRIIFITSPMAHMGFAGQANYAASKAGQIGMMKSLSKETAKRKITVNCVSPGFIATDLLRDLTPEQQAAYKNMVPMRRFGTPEEVAAAVLFLAGVQASYINGAVLDVTGGL